MGAKEETDSRVAAVIMGMVDSLIAKFAAVLPGMAGKGLAAMSDVLKEKDITIWDKTVDSWVAKGYCDADTGEVLKKFRDDVTFLGPLMTVMIRVKMLMLLMSSSMDVVGLDRQYDLMSKTTPNPAPADNLVRSMIIDPARATENRAQMKRLGYSDTQIDNIILSHYNVVGEGTIMINYLRGNIDSD